MLTETQLETFVALADENGFCFEAEEVTETQDAVSDFAMKYGQPHEIDGDMMIWHGIQPTKGQQRRDLFVMDFGSARAVKAI